MISIILRVVALTIGGIIVCAVSGAMGYMASDLPIPAEAGQAASQFFVSGWLILGALYGAYKFFDMVVRYSKGDKV